MTRMLSGLAVMVALVCLPAVGHAQIPGVNTELMSSMSKALGGASPTQAAGAAGAIFGMAQSRLSADDFAKVSKAVPGMAGLLKAAPAVGAEGYGASGLAGLTSSFTKLGLKPEMVTQVLPIVTQYVTKSGGAEVGKLLASVLK